jgi:ribosome-associated protein
MHDDSAMIQDETPAIGAVPADSLPGDAVPGNSPQLTDSIAEKEEKSVGTTSVEAAPLSPEDQAILEQVRRAAFAINEKKGEELLILRLIALTEFTDYFVIGTGNSTRQTQAMADEVTARLKEIQVRPLHTEGYATGEWILIDYGTFVVHLFTREARRFYDLERLWRDAERIE